jgi:hypothetical protein
LYALQPSIPHLTRSSLHRCLQRHGISRLPEVEADKTKKQKLATYPIGYFHIDIAEVQTEDGKLHMFAVETGADPVAERKAAREARTFCEIAEEFLKFHVTKRKSRTGSEYRRMLDAYPSCYRFQAHRRYSAR